jgi:hypothetical protein
MIYMHTPLKKNGPAGPLAGNFGVPNWRALKLLKLMVFTDFNV